MYRVCICVCTYKRPNLLIKLLNSIKTMIENNQNQLNLYLVIVDNDKEGSANCIVIDSIFSNLNITYEIEPNKGISHARNKCINIALNLNSDFIAFVDDDEIVSPNWIYELFNTIIKFEGDIARGPVIRLLPDDTSKWVNKSKVFEVKRFKTGTRIDLCFSGNVLFKTEIIKREHISFDLNYALTGGEDTKFFMELSKKQYKILFANEAIVYEWVPKNRVKLSYIIRRAFIDSINYVHIEKELGNNMNIYLRPIKALINLLKSIIFLCFSWIFGICGIVKSLQCVARALGQLAGFLSKSSINNY